MLVRTILLGAATLAISTGAALAAPTSIQFGVDPGSVQSRLVSQGPTGILQDGGAPVLPADIETAPGDFSGVGDLILFNTDDDGNLTAAARCSASRVGRKRILTAGHCAADDAGNVAFEQAFIDFRNSDGEVERHFTKIITRDQIHPDFTGNLLAGNDVAVLNLASVPSDDITIHEVFRDDSDRGSEFGIVGFGTSGTGDTGGTIGSGPIGGATQRAGLNVFDDFLFDFGFGDPDSILWFDFDNGNPLNDAFGNLTRLVLDQFGIDFGLEDTGVGPFEVNSAPGDSGGPSFIDGKIAAVTSFGITSVGITINGIPIGGDVDQVTNSSFGEFSGNARIFTALDFIDRRLIPVPATLLLFATGMFGIAMAGRRRRHMR